MNKTITAERTWQVTQYEPLRFSDTIQEIPEHITTNPEAMRLLRYLQLVDIEWAYVKYLELKANTPKITSIEAIQEAREFLEEERRQVFASLFETIKPKEE